MRLLRRLRSLFRIGSVDADLTEELEFHHEMRKREIEQAGLAAQDAANAAARAMGNMTRAREDARGVWLPSFFDSLLQDTAYALRNLKRHAGFSSLVIATLAIAIGLNTSVFTVFNAAALRPWPVRDPDRVVTIFQVAAEAPHGANDVVGFPIAEARFLDANTHSFEGIAATRSVSVRIGDDNTARRSRATVVTGNYFRVLGVEMERGRGFLPHEDETPNAVAVLSYSLWQNRLAGDADIVGKQVQLDGVPFTIVGVSSKDFAGTLESRSDVWIPLTSLRLLRPLDTTVRALLEQPDYCCSAVAGRLRPGITRDEARAELAVVRRGFQLQHTRKPGTIVLRDTRLLSQPGAKGVITKVFTLMFAGVVLVLLLACSNVGNLLIARAAARQREIATRLSIGASRPRIIRQLLTESLVMATAAGLAGVVIAYVLPPFVLAQTTENPPNLRLQPDWNVLAFSLLLSIATTFLFGIAPALHATRASVTDALKEHGSRSRLRLRNALVGVQVAVSVVLLVAAGLMMRGVQYGSERDPGFTVENLTVVTFDLPATSYIPARIRNLMAGVEDALRSKPNPQPYGFARSAPFSNAHWWTSFRLRGEEPKRDRMIEIQEVAGDYFGVLGIPIITGRGFQTANTDRFILVNETLARRYLGGREALGKELIVGGKETSQVIGIVKDVYSTRLDAVEPMIYAPVSGREMPHLLVRSSPTIALQSFGAIARRIDTQIQVRVEPLSAQLKRSLSPARTGSALAAILGIIALGLAAVGIFGVVSFLVRQRTQEIGVRMALGARPSQIVALVFGTCTRSVLAGCAVGIVVAAVASRVIRSFLYGLSEFDPLTYAGVLLILVLVLAAATWLPARRATHIEPIRALRYE